MYKQDLAHVHDSHGSNEIQDSRNPPDSTALCNPAKNQHHRQHYNHQRSKLYPSMDQTLSY